MELAEKGIRVNSINPGFIDTNFHNIALGVGRETDSYADVLEQAKSKHPLNRIGHIDDCVNAIAFLANEGSNFITGHQLRVDGQYDIFIPCVSLTILSIFFPSILGGLSTKGAY